MQDTVLVAYATKMGSTRVVAGSIAATLREHGLEAELVPAEKVRDLDRYTAVVLGGALYMGRWHRDARSFLKRHRKALARFPVAFFAMGPRTIEEQDIAASREQLERSLKKVPELNPVSIAIFGGVVDTAHLHFPFKRMPKGDARDWDAIRDWAIELAASLRTSGESAGS
jgi:menaquinone-dependent protoporphyrinogen oxidase